MLAQRARLPAITPKQVLRALERGRFFIHHVRGIHHYPGIRTDSRNPPVVVPLHGRDIKRGVLSSILKQARLTPEEFLKLL